MPDRIHLTVATVIERDARFLMVRERDGGVEVINQPAGHVEPGETLEAAARRETLEETGWQVELTGLLGLSHYRSPRNGATYYRVSFCARPLKRTADAPLDEGIIAAEWLSPEALDGCDNLRSPMVLADIRRYLAGDIHPLALLHHHGEDGP